MIVFVDKQTGKIEGTFEGRVHTPQQLNMWIGDKEKTLRIVIEWKPINERFEIVEKQVIDGYSLDEEGFDVPHFRTIKQKIKKVDYEPEHSQKKLLIDFAEGIKSIHHYRYDFASEKFVKIPKKDL